MSEMRSHNPNDGNATPQKRVEKPVASGKLRKKSEISKLSDVFLADDVGNVGRFIVNDVVIPTVKNLFYDIVENSLKMALFGERGRGGRKTSRNGEFVDYNRVSSRRVERDPYDEPPVRTRYRYNDIEYETRGEAEYVLDQMDALIDRYGRVSIADLYDLSEITGEYTEHRYGWTNLSGADIYRNRYGKYMIKFPKAVPLGR